ncbi:MAG: 50S ribosomal protein L11 methyltransferase [Bacteroidota bacterium]
MDNNTFTDDYWVYTFKADPVTLEILLALLTDKDLFETYQELEGSFEAYILERIDQKEIQIELEQLQSSFSFEVEKSLMKAKNWNAKWEADFQPVVVSNFCSIRADFHPPIRNIKHDIVINPKMAFGTGHHETTYMMIEAMQQIDFHRKKVLDYGAGTGVLAILASKLGADPIDAVDIERPAYENAIDNNNINGVDNVQVYLGTLDAILDKGYDVILANINRNVILKSLAPLKYKLRKGGVLLISGILLEDEQLILDQLLTNEYLVAERREKGNWLCMKVIN